MRLNVISLAARADRRAQFTAWNARPDVEFAFVDAVVGASLDRAALVGQNIITADNLRFTPGALGCAMSHHALWLAARDSGTPVIVCEDDACLRGDFTTQAQRVLSELPSDWDICYLGYNTDAVVAVQSDDGLKALLYFDENAKRAPGYFEAFTRLQAPAPTPLQCFQAWGTLCYAVSPAGARRLLELCFPMRDETEVVMFGQNRALKPYGIDGMINLALQRAPLRAFCTVPPLVVSDNDATKSDVVAR